MELEAVKVISGGDCPIPTIWCGYWIGDDLLILQ